MGTEEKYYSIDEVLVKYERGANFCLRKAELLVSKTRKKLFTMSACDIKNAQKNGWLNPEYLHSNSELRRVIYTHVFATEPEKFLKDEGQQKSSPSIKPSSGWDLTAQDEKFLRGFKINPE